MYTYIICIYICIQEAWKNSGQQDTIMLERQRRVVQSLKRVAWHERGAAAGTGTEDGSIDADNVIMSGGYEGWRARTVSATHTSGAVYLP